MKTEVETIIFDPPGCTREGGPPLGCVVAADFGRYWVAGIFRGIEAGKVQIGQDDAPLRFLRRLIILEKAK